MTLPGFYDGNDTWKIRFAPAKEGEWTITAHSDVLELDNQQVKLECMSNGMQPIQMLSGVWRRKHNTKNLTAIKLTD